MQLIKNYQFNILIAVIIFIVDRLVKSAFYIERDALINYTKNLGIAFGIYVPKVFLLSIILTMIIILVVLLILAWRQKKYLNFSAYFFVILGAIDNVVDRLYYGFVIDYIDLKIWPVFNLADVLISSGVILILYQLYHQPKLKN